MYTLTLSAADRKAIDWIGNRYRHGNDLWNILTDCDTSPSWDSSDCLWEDSIDIEFFIPEHKSWEIVSIIEEDGLACFSSELVEKLLEFQGKLV